MGPPKKAGSWWRGLTECSPLDKGMANHFGILEEAEVEWFYEDLQDLLELIPRKDVLFIIGDWNAKVGSQETPGVIGKFGVQNEAGQTLIEFC